MVFEAEKKVRFGEIDPAGIVYYPRFFHFYHVAMEEFFDRAVGTPYAEVVGGWRIGLPAVRVEAEFDEPVHFGDVLTLRLSVMRLGTSSVRMRYRAMLDGRRTCAHAQVTTVCVDMDSFRARPIPQRLRRVLQRFLEDASGDGGASPPSATRD